MANKTLKIRNFEQNFFFSYQKLEIILVWIHVLFLTMTGFLYIHVHCTVPKHKTQNFSHLPFQNIMRRFYAVLVFKSSYFFPVGLGEIRLF